jgi:hypothetical protein
MATGDLSPAPYRPESAQAKRAIHTPAEELWELKTRVRTASEPRDKYMTLKELCALVYSRFGELRRTETTAPQGFSKEAWDKDWEDIQRLFREAASFKVIIPKLPGVEPIAFRYGLPQYEIVAEDNQVLSTVYANEVKVLLESHNKRDTENILWGAVDKLIELEGELELYLSKYGLYDSKTRIHFEETGYNRDVREQRLGAFNTGGSQKVLRGDGED